MNVRRNVSLWAILNTIVIIAAAVPVLWIASLSFKDPSTISEATFFPRKWTLENYRGIFDTPLFYRALINSVAIALIATVLAVVVGSMASYAIARLAFPGKTVLIASTLLVAMFPPISLVSPLFNLWRQLGLFDTWPGLIIPYLTFSLPLAIYALSAFFREIPWELERAAQVDGATPYQAFMKVIAPLAAPGVVTTAILVFMFCWNDFVFAISLTSTNRSRTAPAAIAFFSGASQFETPVGSIAAAGVIITIPIIIFVFILQRRIVEGLTAGAVKG
jgi:multiple sugar transport system permease protein